MRYSLLRHARALPNDQTNEMSFGFSGPPAPVYVWFAHNRATWGVSRRFSPYPAERWSPDGKWIAFDGMRASVEPNIAHGNIYVLPADGGPFRRATVVSCRLRSQLGS
jgi:hypothetical protein